MVQPYRLRRWTYTGGVEIIATTAPGHRSHPIFVVGGQAFAPVLDCTGEGGAPLAMGRTRYRLMRVGAGGRLPARPAC